MIYFNKETVLISETPDHVLVTADLLGGGGGGGGGGAPLPPPGAGAGAGAGAIPMRIILHSLNLS